jgi:hypothetical protein
MTKAAIAAAATTPNTITRISIRFEPPAETPPADGAVAALVAAYLEGGAAPAAAVRRLGLLPAQAAEKVNEAFVALLGDVLVEPCGDEFVLIEDYREEAEQWLNNNRE